MKVHSLKSTLNYWSWLAVILVGFCGSSLAAGSQVGQGPLVGKKAPAFQVQGIFHEPYSLETFKGHILVLQFGTSW